MAYFRGPITGLFTALLAACGQSANDSSSTADATIAATSGGDTGNITGADLARHIEILASDAFEGRAPGSAGGEKTREYIAEEYARIGLEPVAGSYEQIVPIVEAELDPATSSFEFQVGGETRALSYKEDVVYWTKRLDENLAFADSDMVFVGYGIVAPEYGWNDYEGLDVAGKTVVILVNDPGFATQDPDIFNGNSMTYYGRWTYKYEEAARQGATAALVIHDTAPAAYGWGVVEGSWSGPQLDLERPNGGADRAIAEGWISNEIARALFSDVGLDLDDMQAAALRDDFEPVRLGDASASATLTTTISRRESANVLGVLPGTERADEYVLYMGHWDHLGVNPTVDGHDQTFNGAVDNATGIAAMLEIAEHFALPENRPDRSIMLVAVTAEESGLLGSAYFAEAPPVALKQIVGGINIDALLPTSPAKDILVIGYGASELENYLEAAAGNHGRYLRPDAEPEKGFFYRSDHISLAKKGVPMLYADSGVELVEGGEEAGRALTADYSANRYHKPADEYHDGWDLSGITDTTQILYEAGAAIANNEDWPNWFDGNEFRALRDAQRAE